MRARMIGLVAVAAVVTPALVEGPSIAAATTAQVFVTGYVDRGYTASGIYTHPGTCAVDPRVIPLGTYITIDGLGVCHAEDTGSAVIGYHVDIWVPTVAQAYAITGWRTATWNAAPSQQVLAYHAVASTPTPTSTGVPPTLVPSATPVPASPTPAPPTMSTSVLPTATSTGDAYAGAMTPIPPAATTEPTTTPKRRRRTFHRRSTRVHPTPVPTSSAQTATAQTTTVPTATVSTATAQTTTVPLTLGLRAPTATVSAASHKLRCHTAHWTIHVAGLRYTYWRTTCH